MNELQSLVRDFHRAFDLTINDTPTLSPKDDRLRVNLIHEEAMELWEAEEDFAEVDDPTQPGAGCPDEQGVLSARIAIADALGDLAYVVYGAGVTYGMDIASVLPHFPVNAGMLIAVNGLFAAAAHEGRKLEILDALSCILGGVADMAEIRGIPLEPVFREIHRSNMTKLWTTEEVAKFWGFETFELFVEYEILEGANGHKAARVAPDGRCWLVKRNDGKVIKSPSYEPANLEPLCARSN